MGACATKSGDLKVKGEPPLVVEDAATTTPPVAEGEKTKADDGVPAAAEADPADVSRRRSLSDLLKEDVEASDGEAGHQEVVKIVTDEVDSAVAATDEAGAPAILPKEEGEAAKAAPQVAVDQPSSATTAVEQDTAEQLTDDVPKGGQEPGSEAKAEEEEKRVDPGSVQVAVAGAAPGAEASEVAGGASA